MAFDYEAAYRKLSAENRSLREDLAILQGATNGDFPATYDRMAGKIRRQSEALDVLNRKVTSQRFRLRTIVEAGRDLTKEEYEAAKAKLESENPSIAGRIEDYAVA